jgi:hypothetical protein
MINIGKIKSHHSAFLKSHDAMVSEMTNESKLEQFAQRYVRDNSGLKMRTGNLVNSTKVRTIRTGSGALVTISNKAKHAWAQDQGSGLYGPKRQKYMIVGNPFLRFMWKGQLVYRRYVMHPGVRPTRFLYNATDATARVVVSWLETRMAQVARKF